MSEPRSIDTGTRPLSRDTPVPYPGPRTRHGRVPAGHGRQPTAERVPRWGALPFKRGIVVVISGAVIGTVITVITGGEPGFVLGFFLVIATLAASFAVEPRAVYRIIPVPALAYLAGAIIAGLIHDSAADTTRTAVAISAAQWAARGFVAMTIATVLVMLVGGARWVLLWRRYGAVSSRNAFIAHSARSPRSAAGPRTARGPRSAGGPGGATSRRGPAGPRTSAGGGDRRRSSPPRPGR